MARNNKYFRCRPVLFGYSRPNPNNIVRLVSADLSGMFPIWVADCRRNKRIFGTIKNTITETINKSKLKKGLTMISDRESNGNHTVTKYLDHPLPLDRDIFVRSDIVSVSICHLYPTYNFVHCPSCCDVVDLAWGIVHQLHRWYI